MTQAQDVRPGEAALSTSDTRRTESEDKFDEAPIVAMQEFPSAKSGHYQRVKIINVPFKYPLIRVEESVEDTPTGRIITRNKMMVADHVVVRLKKGTNAARFARRNKMSIRRKLILPDVYLMKVPATVNGVLDAIKSLKKQKEVLFVHEDAIDQINSVPNNSPFFTKQWALNDPDEDHDIDAPEAWDYVTGDASVKVAVIDSGVWMNHPDLAANIYTNPNPNILPGDVFDGSNSIQYDIHGWDFFNDDADPTDENGHGTSVAGIIGASGNNGEGGEGVCWTVKIVPIKTSGKDAMNPQSITTEGIWYAASLGVDVINMSLGSNMYYQGMELALEETSKKNILVVCSASNDGSNNDSTPYYPAGYDFPNIISVAASDSDDVLPDFSNYGMNSVDLAAPGVNCLTTSLPYADLPYLLQYETYETYAWFSGTSAAAPYVAGVGALVKALDPSLGGTQIKSIILQSVDKISGLTGKVATGGRLNAFRAIKKTLDDDLAPLHVEPDSYTVPFRKLLNVQSGPPASDATSVTKGPVVLANDTIPVGSFAVNVDLYGNPSKGGTVTFANGNFSYNNLDQNFIGTETFEYLVTADSNSAIGKVTITTLPPIIRDDAYTSSGNQIVVNEGYGALNNDEYNILPGEAEIIQQPNYGILTPQMNNGVWIGRFTYTRTSNFGINAVDTFKYRVFVPGNPEAMVTLTTQYIPKFNLVWEEWIPPFNINEIASYVVPSYDNAPVHIDVQFPEIGRGSVQILQQPKRGKVTLANNHLEYVPNRSSKRTDKFQVFVSDSAKSRTIEVAIEPKSAKMLQ